MLPGSGKQEVMQLVLVNIPPRSMRWQILADSAQLQFSGSKSMLGHFCHEEGRHNLSCDRVISVDMRGLGDLTCTRSGSSASIVAVRLGTQERIREHGISRESS